MQNSQTQQKQKDVSNTQKYVDTNDKENYPLVERIPIDNTPFIIIGNLELGFKVTFGKYSFNDEPFKTIEETLEWFDLNQWTVIIHLIAVGVTATLENRK